MLRALCIDVADRRARRASWPRCRRRRRRAARLGCRAAHREDAPSARTRPTALFSRTRAAGGLCRPSGERFFSLGICMFNQGSRRTTTTRPNRATPPCAITTCPRPGRMPACAGSSRGASRPSADGATTRRCEQSSEHDLWITPVLHLGSTSGAPWFDMWDEKVIRRIEEVAEKTIVPLRDDPRVIGYYSDNELGWWNAIMWKMTLEQPASSGQRQRLVRLVPRSLRRRLERARRAISSRRAPPVGKNSNASGMLWLRPGSKGIHTMRRFLAWWPTATTS